MRSLSKDDDPAFSKMFWRGMGMAIIAGFVIAMCMILMGLVAYYSHKYGWR